MKRWQWVAVIAIALAAHALTVGNGLVFDDRPAILDNPLVTGSFDLKGLWTLDFWGRPAGAGVGTWRPLTTASFLVDWRIGGGAAWPFHLTNLALHTLASLLLGVALVTQLGPGRRRLALVAAGLFAAFAVHSDAVAAVVGRADVLSAALLFAALWALGPADAPPRPGRLVAGGLLVAAALLSKESALVAAPLLFMLDTIALGRVQRPWSPRLLVVAGACVLYLIVRQWTALPLSAVHVTAWDNPLVGEPLWVRALTALRLTTLGLRLALIPLGLQPDYSANEVLPDRALSVDVVAGALVVALAVGSAWRLRRRAPALAVAVTLWLGPWLLVSNLGRVGPAIFAERLLYLPSAGLALAFALSLAWLAQRSRATAAVLALALVAGNLAIAARQARVWHDELSLFGDAVVAAPRCARAFHNYGASLLAAGRTAEALTAFERASAILPEWPAPHRLSAVAWESAGRLDEAERHLRRAASLGPPSAARTADVLTLSRFLVKHNRGAEAIELLRGAAP